MHIRHFEWLEICGSSCLTAVMLCALSAAPAVLGCTCTSSEGVVTMRDLAQRYLDQSKVVFEGQVESQEVKSGSILAPRTATSMTPGLVHRLVTIRVLHAYRGSNQEILAVLTGLGAGDCGVDFEVGKRYLVYADRVDDRTFFTSICTGTALLEDSGPALRLLRKEPPSPNDLLNPELYWKRTVRRTGIVCGQVIRPDGNPLGDAMVEFGRFAMTLFLRTGMVLRLRPMEPFVSRVFPQGSISLRRKQMISRLARV